MRLLIIAASLTVLTACGQQAAEAPAPEEAAPAAEAAALATANGAPTGTYTVASADGTVLGTSTIKDDGTYSDTAPDGKSMEGTWAVVEGKTCFTLKEEGAKPECWTENAPAADGSFTATSDTGETVKVTPVAAAAPAAEPAPAAGE